MFERVFLCVLSALCSENYFGQRGLKPAST